ncbi:hypothetical protein M9H77_08332 [Catharanthus roseus]|uniref:Uncharacterized protein n=1 Tax=Catharanthus roseus TaxID=4058 RepID=A0ACC0BXN7_CATRO|nr:hypothetical protein M9H77_08332 [Catharanthus roseus]
MRDEGGGGEDWGNTSVAILAERFSKSKELEKLHKYRSREKEGSMEILERFHKAKRKAKEEATATGTAMPDDLALMAIVAGGAIHLRGESGGAQSCRGLTSIGPCCNDMLRRVEAIVYGAESFGVHSAATCVGPRQSGHG